MWIISLSEFLYGLLLPFQDIPKVSIFGIDIRLAIFALPVLLLSLLFEYRKKRIESNHKLVMLTQSIAPLVLVMIFNILFINSDLRAAGFLFWFLLNVMTILYVLIKRDSKIYIGFLCGTALACLHIMIQRYNPFFLVDIATILRCVDHESHYRVFSYYGEPSYAALYLLAFYYYLTEGYAQYRYLAVFVLLALGLTYSKLALVGVCVVMFWRFLQFYRSDSLKIQDARFLCAQVMAACLVFWLMLYGSPHLYKNNDIEYGPKTDLATKHAVSDLLEKTNSEVEKYSARQLSVKRGMIAFLQAPIFGVGLANSKKYIAEQKILDVKYGYFEGISNLYLEILIEVGLIGLVAFLWMLWSFYSSGLIVFNSGVFWFVLLVPMQFCQNINMPAIWLSLILSIATKWDDNHKLTNSLKQSL